MKKYYEINEELAKESKEMEEQEKYNSFTLYKLLRNALNDNEIEHHESDLYCKITDKSKQIVKNYKYIGNVKTFSDNIDNELWYDIPFAYPIFLKSLNNLSKTTRDVIMQLSEVAFIQVDELEEDVQIALNDDLNRLRLFYYIDSNTLLPGILEEFQETCHIDIDELIEDNEC